MTLSERDILGSVAEIINEDCGVPFDSIKPDARLGEDLGLDGSDLTTIFTDIVNKFRLTAVDAAPDNALYLVGDLVSFIQGELG